jgi:hypothetical protein
LINGSVPSTNTVLILEAGSEKVPLKKFTALCV